MRVAESASFRYPGQVKLMNVIEEFPFLVIKLSPYYERR